MFIGRRNSSLRISPGWMGGNFSEADACASFIAAIVSFVGEEAGEWIVASGPGCEASLPRGEQAVQRLLRGRSGDAFERAE